MTATYIVKFKVLAVPRAYARQGYAGASFPYQTSVTASSSKEAVNALKRKIKRKKVLIISVKKV